MIPSGPPKFIPKIYGFKIFGMRGSKYELKYDYKGQPINEEEIKDVLRKGGKWAIGQQDGSQKQQSHIPVASSNMKKINEEEQKMSL